MAAPSAPVRILGIDPGTRVAGWGIVERSGHDLALVGTGVIRAPEDAPIGARLAAIFEGVRTVLAAHEVGLACVEEAFHGKNARSAIRLGEGRAVAILAATLAGLGVVELAPAAVKKAVCGNGAATKEQVRSAVFAQLGPRSHEAARGLPADATDALALALAAHARASSPHSPESRRRSGRRWTMDDLARLTETRERHDG